MNRSLRALKGVAVATVLGCSLLTVAPPASSSPAAPAAPAPLSASGPYGALGDGELLHLTLADIAESLDDPLLADILDQVLDLVGLGGTLTLADIGLPTTHSEADSDGPVNGVDADRTFADAFNLEASLLEGADGSIDLDGVLSDAAVSAPPSETISADLLDLGPGSPLATLVEANVSSVDATANWVSDTECVASTEPLAQSRVETAGLTVLPAADLVTIDNPSDQGLTFAQTTLDLPATGGPLDERAVRSTSTSQLDQITIAGALSLGLETPATLTATATGQPGGAGFTYVAPQLVNLNGNAVIDQDTLNTLLDTLVNQLLGGPALGLINDALALIPGAPPLLEMSATVQGDTSGLGNAEGTFVDASFSAVTLDVNVLGLALVDLDLLPMRAAAAAPVGGIRCGADNNNPVELSKVNSGPAIPGATFDYTIAVGNVGLCTLQNVAVTDAMTGPAGSTVVLTEPTASSVGAPEPAGAGLERTLITWADIGPIAPNAQTTLRIRVQVPASATVGQRYEDVVNVTATCDGRTVTRTFTLNEPPVEAPGTGPCDLTGSNKSASHVEVYPGEQFTFFVNVFNDAAEACTNVTITDTLSEKVTFVSCSDGCTVSGRTVTWTIPTMPAGQSLTLRVTVSVNAGATGTVPNTAIIDTPTTDPVTVSTPGPTITDRSVLAPNQPAGRGDDELARTGPAGSPLAWPVALGLGILALGAQRLRRRGAVST